MLEFIERVRAAAECKICNNLLNNPNTLPCQHHFCSTCLTAHMVQSSSCPTCKVPFPWRSDCSPNLKLCNILEAYHALVLELEPAPVLDIEFVGESQDSQMDVPTQMDQRGEIESEPETMEFDFETQMDCETRLNSPNSSQEGFPVYPGLENTVPEVSTQEISLLRSRHMQCVGPQILLTAFPTSQVVLVVFFVSLLTLVIGLVCREY